jgi:glycosyltransferase involved in cell wall biosynthesis
MRATVLIPTHDHGPLLLRAARSALAQSVRELELFIVGDGVTPATREAVDALGREDARVRFFDRPKGPRNGEAYRHAVLGEARGRIVCYLCDDDLWLPDHVETMERCLARANIVPARPRVVGGRRKVGSVDRAYYRERMQRDPPFNVMGLSSGAHTLELYRRLPFGWRTAPEGLATDLHMWRQILACPDAIPAVAPHLTVLSFPAPARRSMSLAERAEELDRWVARLAPEERLSLEREYAAWVCEARDETAEELLARDASLTARLAGRARRSPFAPALRWLAGKLAR